MDGVGDRWVGGWVGGWVGRTFLPFSAGCRRGRWVGGWLGGTYLLKT